MLQHIFICVLCITMINHGIHIMDKFPNTHASSDPEVMFQTALPDDGKEASPSATWVAGDLTSRLDDGQNGCYPFTAASVNFSGSIFHDANVLSEKW